jgi:hypothetical protein
MGAGAGIQPPLIEFQLRPHGQKRRAPPSSPSPVIAPLSKILKHYSNYWAQRTQPRAFLGPNIPEPHPVTVALQNEATEDGLE